MRSGFGSLLASEALWRDLAFEGYAFIARADKEEAEKMFEGTPWQITEVSPDSQYLRVEAKCSKK
jgi:hypothetical protein